MENSFLTSKDIAEHLNVSIATVKNLCDSGELPAIKIGNQWRIDPIDFHDYINTLKAKHAKKDKI